MSLPDTLRSCLQPAADRGPDVPGIGAGIGYGGLPHRRDRLVPDRQLPHASTSSTAGSPICPMT